MVASSDGTHAARAVAVACEHLSVALGAATVLHDVSLTVDQGQTVALLGGNGSGKTTLLRALLGLVPLAGGEARLFGEPVASFRDWARVGYVPQRGALDVPTASVAEIVASGRLARRRVFRPPTADDRAAVADALALVHLTDLARRPVTQLSGGQRQRALIARALATRPDLVVLDEPLAGLDLDTQAGLADILGDLKAGGTAILVVLHELGPMAPLVDDSVVLRDGRVLYHGPLIELDEAGHRGHDHPDAATPAPGLRLTLLPTPGGPR